MLVVGATGYIGKFVVRELVKRGYDVVALARERSGVGGKATRDDVQRVRATITSLKPYFKVLGGGGARHVVGSSSASSATWRQCCVPALHCFLISVVRVLAAWARLESGVCQDFDCIA